MSQSKISGGGRLATALLLTCSLTAIAAAQPATTPAPKKAAEEVVVTAQRRAERLKDVPIAVTVLSPTRLQQLQILNVAQLQTVTPSLSFASGISYAQTYIRGIGDALTNPGVEQGVSTYTDGAYVERSVGTTFDLVDVSSVQVLKGPQGTLYGRNATGGAVLITSADPQNRLAGSINTEAGSEGHYLVDGMVNIPITDELAMRFAGRYQTDGNYIKDLNPADGAFGASESDIGRVKLAYRPNDSGFSAVLEYEYDHDWRTQDANTEALPSVYCLYCSQSKYTYPLSPYTTAVDRVHGPGGDDRSDFYNLRLSEDLGVVSLTSVTAFRHSRSIGLGDYDFTEIPAFNIGQTGGANTFTEDLTATTHFAGMFNAIGGISYLHDQSFVNVSIYSGYNDNIPPTDANIVKTNSIAGFGEGTLEPIKGLKLTFGGRYTSDNRSLYYQKAGFDKFTPRFVASYDMGPVNVYASYNTGFKSGGFSTPLGAPPASIFKPEKIQSYEVGLKYASTDHRVTANLAAFRYTLTDLQVATINQSDIANITTFQNADAAGEGFEFEPNYRATDNLNFFGGGAYLNAYYTSYKGASTQDPVYNAAGQPIGFAAGSEDLTDHRLPHAPRWSGFIGTRITQTLYDEWTGEFNAVFKYTSSYDFLPGGGGPLDADKNNAFTTGQISASVSPPGGRYKIGFYIDNVTDAKYANWRFSTAPFGGLEIEARPITVGAQLSYKF
jgi:iron complex outermembrane receptor protein